VESGKWKAESGKMAQKCRMKYRKNTERNTAKTPNEIPQKCRTKYRKSTERYCTKMPNGIE
jgi:hypothetical protein